MITFETGNLFDSRAQTLVNPVNCVGVMGAGLAREFKERYPSMFQEYWKACQSGQLRPGNLLTIPVGNDKYILNFPTKDDWRNPTEWEYLEKGMATFIRVYRELGITSVAFPLLGAGLGGLNKLEVFDFLVEHLQYVDIHVIIYH